MSLFVGASALVALARREDDAETLLAEVESAEERLTSPLAFWETFRALAKSSTSTDAALLEVERLLDVLDIAMVTMGEAEAAEAVRAHIRYGKGRHPAGLNMGDCFAYACARTNGARLLYKGDDFARTDMAA